MRRVLEEVKYKNRQPLSLAYYKHKRVSTILWTSHQLWSEVIGGGEIWLLAIPEHEYKDVWPDEVVTTGKIYENSLTTVGGEKFTYDFTITKHKSPWYGHKELKKAEKSKEVQDEQV